MNAHPTDLLGDDDCEVGRPDHVPVTARGRRFARLARRHAEQRWAQWCESEAWREACPYWQSCNGGPKDLPGVYGPGTCMGGCSTEPACMT